MHQKLSNREIEDENDVSMLPMMESGDQKQKPNNQKDAKLGKETKDSKGDYIKGIPQFSEFENKRLFDIEAESIDIKASYDVKHKCLTEESKDSRSHNIIELPKSGRLSNIEAIERIVQIFKFDDNLKEIQVKPKENAHINQLDFSTNFKKGEKVFFDNKLTIFKVIKESNKSKSFFKFMTSNNQRFMLIDNGNLISLIKTTNKPKDPYIVKSILCLNKLFQIILDQKEKMKVRLFFFNEKFDPRIPPTHKKYKFDTNDKKTEFLRWIKTELEIKQQEMIFK